MQSETADFASVAATWWTGRNIYSVFDSGQFAQLCENTTSSTKVHNIADIAVRVEPSHGHIHLEKRCRPNGT